MQGPGSALKRPLVPIAIKYLRPRTTDGFWDVIVDRCKAALARHVRHIGPGLWRIIHFDGEEYEIRLAFDQTPHSAVEQDALTDLNPTTGSAKPLQHGKIDLFEFLTQFEEIYYRKPREFEQRTSDLIVQCAKYQKEVLAHKLPASARAFDEDTLVAQLLRCFLISAELNTVNGWYTPLDFMDVGINNVMMRDEGDDDYWGLEPSITVQLLKPSGSAYKRMRKNTRGQHQSFSAILETAISNLQRLIFRRRPQDIPCLIYSLCLLALTVSALSMTHAPFLLPVKLAGEELDDTFQTLCDLYLFSLGHAHPLRDEVDMAAYASSVDDDPVSVKHFDALNRLWQQFGEWNPGLGIVSLHYILILLSQTVTTQDLWTETSTFRSTILLILTPIAGLLMIEIPLLF
ncbi:MAG: hypothetical protein Q9212_003349 [Teloschistes hypoglaucus]